MAELFVDTSAWYPVVVESHADHAAVALVLTNAVRAGARVVTTNLVVMETHALLLHRVNWSVALRFVKSVAEPPTVVVSSSPDVERKAVADWLERYSDQDFSFTDAVSFAVMRARGITQALALDAHFTVAGFQALPTVHRGRRKRY